MTEKQNDTSKRTDSPKSKFEKEFEALPLEQKIAQLMRLEAVTLSETFTYVVNSPMKVVEKVGDVITEFGAKIEREARNAASAKAEPSKGSTTSAKSASTRPKAGKKSPPSAKP